MSEGYHGYYNYLEICGQSMQTSGACGLHLAFVSIDQKIIHAKSIPKVQKNITERKIIYQL